MPTHQPPAPVVQHDDPLAITSMVLGVVAVSCLGFVTGIPAIILAIISLVRKSPSRGLSLAGLVTGIIGTIVSFIIVALFVLLVILAAASPEQVNPATPVPYQAQPYSHNQV